ncbi:unnamed protein product, partial [Lymnaea stagnalis]
LGPYEVEVSCGGEAAVNAKKSSCKKNPGHINFIPFEQFSISDLPDRYKEADDMYDTIKALASITVLINGAFISQDRPEKLSDGTLYPLFNKAGTAAVLNGTGKLTHTKVYTEEDDKACPCQDCKLAETPVKKWGTIAVFTAKHVIFDDSEAAAATFEMTYEHARETKKHILKGVCLEDCDLDLDWCRVTCVEHDTEFVKFVDKTLICGYENRHNDIVKKYLHSEPRGKGQMVVIVSHPHGCDKLISVGECVEREEVMCVFTHLSTKYKYTTATCPGSSGAPVYVVKPWFSNHTHSG